MPVNHRGGQAAAIPRERLERNPLITPAAYARLAAILQDPDAPPWNYTVGDRLRAEDLPGVERMRKALRAAGRPGAGRPPAWVSGWVRALRPRVPLFRRRLPEGFDLERDWALVPAMDRGDIAAGIEELVPLDADLSRLIVYDTSGVTGHAIQVPHHPAAVAQNHPLLEFVLARHGVKLRFREGKVACLNVGAQLDTVVYATTFSVWNNACFAKVNLHGRRWDPQRARRFFRRLRPAFLTGDPVGFAEMLKWGVDIRPAALVSTAVALAPALKARLRRAYGCPVIDTYATTETGMLAYDSPDGRGMRVLPPDFYVEIVDDDGRPLPEGEKGWICVTGGRNPYLPLLRYRTGDRARLVWSRPAASDPAPRLLDLEAREAVSFRAADGAVISPVDIGRVIRKWVFSQHEFVQRRDGSCDLAVRSARGCPVDTAAMAARLKELFGAGVKVTVRADERLGEGRPGGKVVPFRCELRGL